MQDHSFCNWQNNNWLKECKNAIDSDDGTVNDHEIYCEFVSVTIGVPYENNLLPDDMKRFSSFVRITTQNKNLAQFWIVIWESRKTNGGVIPKVFWFLEKDLVDVEKELFTCIQMNAPKQIQCFKDEKHVSTRFITMDFHVRNHHQGIANVVNKWPNERVMEVYAGNDSKRRSALVRTQNGEYKRPAAKLAILDLGSQV